MSSSSSSSTPFVFTTGTGKTYKQVSYKNSKSNTGQYNSTFIYVCSFVDATAVRDWLLSQTDPYDAGLLCNSVVIDPADNDIEGFSGSAKLTATYASGSMMAKYHANQPFVIEWDFREQSFPISGGKVYWNNDTTKPIQNKNLLPTFNQFIGVCKLSGVRTSWDIGNITPYFNMINNGTWGGADTHTLLFVPPKVLLRPDANNSISMELWWLPNLYDGQDGWKTIFNETTGKWDYPTWQDNTGTWRNTYGECDFSGLLTLGI
jgi:hypothetical protein